MMRYRLLAVGVLVCVAVVAVVLCVLAAAGPPRHRLLAADAEAAFAVPAFVIGLDRHWKDRGRITMRRLRDAGHTDLTRFRGTDAFTDPDADEVFRRFKLVKRPKIMHTRGERGCSASHLRLYTHMIRHGIPRAVVYEDDAQPCDDYAAYFPAILRLAAPYDLVLIGHMARNPGPRGELVVPGGSFAYHAYVISLAGARKTIRDVERHGYWEPIDMTAGKFADTRIGLTRALANHRAARGPIRFGGRPRSNGRSFGFVAQDGRLGTSIKSAKIERWVG